MRAPSVYFLVLRDVSGLFSVNCAFPRVRVRAAIARDEDRCCSSLEGESPPGRTIVVVGLRVLENLAEAF